MGAKPISLVALVAAALLLGACGDDDDGGAQARGIVRTPVPDVTGPTLPDADGRDFAFRADDGGLLLVYFGYTTCPDICPSTLADIRLALNAIGDDADRVEVAMATIDPDRDTPDRLLRYLGSFVEDAHALQTTDDERLRAAADAFGASYSVTTSDDGEIEVIHSGSLYAVDDRGMLQLTWPFGTSPDDLAHDLHLLLAS